MTVGSTLQARPLQVTSTALSDSVVLIAGMWEVERTLAGKTAVVGLLRMSAVLPRMDMDNAWSSGIAWPMQQISDWLQKQGLSEYLQLFVENRIDLSILPDLTDEHLKDLGLPLGID